MQISCATHKCVCACCVNVYVRVCICDVSQPRWMHPLIAATCRCARSLHALLKKRSEKQAHCFFAHKIKMALRSAAALLAKRGFSLAGGAPAGLKECSPFALQHLEGLPSTLQA